MLGLILFLAAAAALLWATVVLWTAWMLTHPPRRTYAGAVARGRPGDPAELSPPRAAASWAFRDPAGNELPAWDIVGDDPAGPVVVLTHGWADSRIGGLARVAALAPVSARIILWDLPGHGEAPGTCGLGPPEAAALRALLEIVRGREGREAGGAGTPIVLFGWSLGAGASIEVAASEPGIAGVIAESPYRVRGTPARNVLAARGLPHRLTLRAALAVAALKRGCRGVDRGFDRAAHASRLACPLLVIHGGADRVSPPEDGRAIAAGAPRGELVELPEAGHNDLWTDPRFAEPLARAVHAFIRRLGAEAPRPRPGSPTLCP